MKKLITLLALVALPFAALASNRIESSFINGAALQLTNNYVYSYGVNWTNNIFVWDFATVGGLWNNQSLSMAYPLSTTNILATTGASGTNYGPPFVSYLTNYTGTFSSTNAVAGGIVVNTNVIQRAAWDDVMAFCDGNADYGQASILVSAYPTAATVVTNLLTFSFSRGDGTYYDNQSTAFTFTVPVLAGGTNCVVVTNVPSTFMQGAIKLRLNSITTSIGLTNSALVVNAIKLLGWSKP